MKLEEMILNSSAVSVAFMTRLADELRSRSNIQLLVLLPLISYSASQGSPQSAMEILRVCSYLGFSAIYEIAFHLESYDIASKLGVRCMDVILGHFRGLQTDDVIRRCHIEAGVLNNVGMALICVGDYGKAIENFVEAAEIICNVLLR